MFFGYLDPVHAPAAADSLRFVERSLGAPALGMTREEGALALAYCRAFVPKRRGAVYPLRFTPGGGEAAS
jgi:hypothetical protein